MALDSLPVAAPPRGVPLRREAASFAGRPISVPQARRFVRDVLRRWDAGTYEEAGSLLVSELATNAVLHARSEVEVELVELEDGVLLGVSDGSAALPVLRRHGREAGTGRGLWLLDQYSQRAGVDVRRPGTGKQVWAVLCPEVAAPDEAALTGWLDQVEGH
jgi:anti-sigma regulatory factor (Ser/Thr protein kinase)